MSKKKNYSKELQPGQRFLLKGMTYVKSTTKDGSRINNRWFDKNTPGTIIKKYEFPVWGDVIENTEYYVVQLDLWEPKLILNESQFVPI